MDKFEKLIKDSVQGYEAPFDPKAWENVSSQLGDSFEQLMKDSTSGYEAPYNPAAWDAVNHQLGPAYSSWKWIGGSAAVIALIAGGSYLVDTNTSDDHELTNYASEEVVVHPSNENAENVYVVDANNHNADQIISENGNDNGNDDGEASNVIHNVNPDLNNNNVHINQNSGNDNVSLNNNGNQNGNNGDHGNVVVNNQNNGNTVENISTNNNGNDNINDYKVISRFTMSSDEICQGDVCLFTPEVVQNDLIYVWNFGDGNFSSTAVTKHKFAKAGEFNVTLEIKEPKTNRTLGSKTESILVNGLPKVNFAWEQSSEVIPTVNFINLTDEAKQWNWNIKGLKQSNKNEFEYTFRKAGNYLVELTATNEDGCTNTAQKTITIEKDYNLLAPTAFSPDGDFKNDEFIPEALKIMDVDFTMTVYDKSGRLVYRTQNAAEPWDGRFTEDNIMAPSGSAYVWRVVLINKNGEQELYEGQVFVIR